MRRLIPLLLLWAAPLSAQEEVQPDPHQFPRDAYVGRNPYVAAADAAYGRRQEGRVGGVASGRLISEAIASYQTAAQAPDNLEARWKLLRAFYFKGAYTGLDADSRRAVFSTARRVSDDAIAILARRAGPRDGTDLVKLAPAARAEALAKQRDAAPSFFWSAACWGQWALAVGKVEAARVGAAERIRDDAATVIAIDPKFEDGGGYRVLGRLHDQAPEIALLAGWVSRQEALRNLRLAVSVETRSFANRHYLAEALARGSAEERAEAVRIEEAVLSGAPSPQHLVEDLAIQEQARRNLEQWRRRVNGES
ncbi:MAG: hypothetical protein ACRD3M_11105 [Thermoanaerobaculia bacterium]